MLEESYSGKKNMGKKMYQQCKGIVRNYVILKA